MRERSSPGTPFSLWQVDNLDPEFIAVNGTIVQDLDNLLVSSAQLCPPSWRPARQLARPLHSSLLCSLRGGIYVALGPPTRGHSPVFLQ